MFKINDKTLLITVLFIFVACGNTNHKSSKKSKNGKEMDRSYNLHQQASEIREKVNHLSTEKGLQDYVEDFFEKNINQLIENNEFLFHYFGLSFTKMDLRAQEKSITFILKLIKDMSDISPNDDYFLLSFFGFLGEKYSTINKEFYLDLLDISDYIRSKLEKGLVTDVYNFQYYLKPISHILNSSINSEYGYYKIFAWIWDQYELRGDYKNILVLNLMEKNLHYMANSPYIIQSLKWNKKRHHTYLNNISVLLNKIQKNKSIKNLDERIERVFHSIQNIYLSNAAQFYRSLHLIQFYLIEKLSPRTKEFIIHKLEDKNYFSRNLLLSTLLSKYKVMTNIDDELTLLSQREEDFSMYLAKNQSVTKSSNLILKTLFKKYSLQKIAGLISKRELPQNVKYQVHHHYQLLLIETYLLYQKFSNLAEFEKEEDLGQGSLGLLMNNFSSPSSIRKEIVIDSLTKKQLVPSLILNLEEISSLKEGNFYFSDLTLFKNNLGKEINFDEMLNKLSSFENLWIDSSGANGTLKEKDHYRHRAPHTPYYYLNACGAPGNRWLVQHRAPPLNICRYIRRVNQSSLYKCHYEDSEFKIYWFDKVNIYPGGTTVGRKLSICSFEYGYKMDPLPIPQKQKSGEDALPIRFDLNKIKLKNSFFVANGGNGIKGDDANSGYACRKIKKNKAGLLKSFPSTIKNLSEYLVDDEEADLFSYLQKINRMSGTYQETKNTDFRFNSASYEPAYLMKGISSTGRKNGRVRMGNAEVGKFKEYYHVGIGVGGDGGNAGRAGFVDTPNAYFLPNLNNSILSLNGFPGLGGTQGFCGSNQKKHHSPNHQGKIGEFIHE